MGSAGTNFYNNAFERQGYGDDVRDVQQLWLAGDKDAARRRVPTAIGLGTNLIGTDDLVRDRLRLYRDAGVTTLRAQPPRRPRHATSTASSTTSNDCSTSCARSTLRPNTQRPRRSTHEVHSA